MPVILAIETPGSRMILLLVLSMITNTPGLSAIPLIQMIISKSGSNIDSVIDKNVPKTRAKVKSVPMWPFPQ